MKHPAFILPVMYACPEKRMRDPKYYSEAFCFVKCVKFNYCSQRWKPPSSVQNLGHGRRRRRKALPACLLPQGLARSSRVAGCCQGDAVK